MTEQILFKKKEMDLFTEDGLTKQTGTPISQWDVYILKELTDNAIDICESAGVDPKIEIIINSSGITVKDNGPGISRETIDKIVDLNIYAGSKYYFARPTRGHQGNALLTILPMPYVLSDGKVIECASIRSGRKQYLISIEHDQIEQDYRFKVNESDTSDAITGTEIKIKVCFEDPTLVASSKRKYAYNRLLNSFSIFNPHCEISKDYFGEIFRYCKKGEIKKMKSERESVHWYSYDAFKELLYAYLRAGHGSTTIKKFCISRFRSIGNGTKNEDLLKYMTSKRLEDLRDKEADIKQLYNNLKSLCGVVSSEVLGEIGEKQLQQFMGEGVRGAKYKHIPGNIEEDDYIIPFVLEGMATEYEDERGISIYAGLNNSPLYDTSSLSSLFQHGDLRLDEIDGINIAIHLICPNVKFTDYSKKEFDLDPFLPAIRQLLKIILSDYYKERDEAIKKKQTEAKENKEREKKEKEEENNKKKEKKLTMQDVFEKTIALVHHEVTDRGTFEAYVRQAFYKHRPVFAEFGFEDLDYGYYVKPLVRDWEIRMGRRMFLRETRGVLLLPDSDDYIPIDTKIVNNFVCPEYTIKNLFYIEKRGFADALRTAQIHRRYDIAILSGQGFTTEDIKLILHKVAKTDSEIKVFGFHDCDIYGIHILNSAGKEHYIEGSKVTITSLGILPSEVKEKKYPVEWYEPTKNKKTKKALAFKYESLKHILSPDDYSWLTEDVGGKRRRVELNIFSPGEFISYVKGKIKDAGITEKLLPPIDVIENTIMATVEDKKEDIVKDAVNKNLSEIDDVIAEIKTTIIDRQIIINTLKDEFSDFVKIDAEELRDVVKTDLEDNPPKSWKEFTKEHVKQELKDIPEWEEHVMEKVDENINREVVNLLKDLHQKISKNSDFMQPV